MINLPNDEARRLAAEESLRLQVSFEMRLAKVLRKELERMGLASSEGYARSGVEGLDVPWLEHTERLHGVLLPAIESEIFYFGGRAIESLIMSGVLTSQPTSSRQVFNQSVDYHMRTYGGNKVVNIADTTRQNIKKVVDEGLNKGHTRETIAKSIWENSKGEMSMARARVIATTESHNAAMSGDYYAMQSTGIPFKKRWLTIIDQRTRKHHAAADNQVQASADPFEVDGELLMYPGDPTASASNVVNCRCNMVYDFD